MRKICRELITIKHFIGKEYTSMLYLLSFCFDSHANDKKLKGSFQILLEAISVQKALGKSLKVIKQKHAKEQFLKDVDRVCLDSVLQISEITNSPLFLNWEERDGAIIMRTAFPSQSPDGSSFYYGGDFPELGEKGTVLHFYK